MSELFQIHEDDLVELERLGPLLAHDLFPVLAKLEGVPGGANRIRKQLEKVKEILSNVRWDYFPWTNCEVIPVADKPEPQ